MYGASAAAFRFQHDVREAQNARETLMIIFLASASEVRGYAATGDPAFAASYRRRSHTFGTVAAALDRDLAGLDLDGGRRFVAQEKQEYERWTHVVAIPTISQPRSAAARLVRTSGSSLGRQIADADRQTGQLLDEAAAKSEASRQALLSRILAVSVVLVGSVAAAVIVLLLSHAAEQQRKLRSAILYDEERRVSRMLQEALVPERLPTLPGVTLSATYVPAAAERQIGGDWYEVLAFTEERVLLIIGDVAGHGLDAAVIMNRVRQAMLGAAVSEVDPARILEQANKSLTASGYGMVTAACCVFDPQSMRLVYASAGHPPPILAPPREQARSLPFGAPPLGVVEDLQVESSTTTLERGTLLVLYTDGLIEEYRDIIAAERSLLTTIEGSRTGSNPATEIFEAMLPDRHPRDDVAILTMRAESTET
jgi:serine phosphatase RsbU (regulator of sigma subunit)